MNKLSNGEFLPNNDLSYASTGQRVAAFAVDLFFVFIFAMYASEVLGPSMPGHLKFIVYAFPWLYFPVAEHSRYQATLGKKWVGIMVERFKFLYRNTNLCWNRRNLLF